MEEILKRIKLYLLHYLFPSALLKTQMTISEKLIRFRVLSDLHFKETMFKIFLIKKVLIIIKNLVVKSVIMLWLKAGIVMAKVESLVRKRRVEEQQRYIQILLKN